MFRFLPHMLCSKQNAGRQISHFVNMSIQPVDCPRIWNMGRVFEKIPHRSGDVITIGPFYLVPLQRGRTQVGI